MTWNRGRVSALALPPALFIALCLIVSWAGFLPRVRAATGVARGARGPDNSAPRLAIRRWTVSKALITPEHTVTVRVTVANVGGGTLDDVHLRAETSEGL